VAILMRWHHAAEIWLLDRLPIWLQDLSVAL
jgi:cytochrome c-type biogenesis protein